MGISATLEVILVALIAFVIGGPARKGSDFRRNIEGSVFDGKCEMDSMMGFRHEMLELNGTQCMKSATSPTTIIASVQLAANGKQLLIREAQKLESDGLLSSPMNIPEPAHATRQYEHGYNSASSLGNGEKRHKDDVRGSRLESVDVNLHTKRPSYPAYNDPLFM